MRTLNVIALILVIIGALAWGLIGFFEYNVIDMLFGAGSSATRVVYGLVGIAGLYALSFFTHNTFVGRD